MNRTVITVLLSVIVLSISASAQKRQVSFTKDVMPIVTVENMVLLLFQENRETAPWSKKCSPIPRSESRCR
ncbi:MAG: hypothetical protein NTV54_12050 [Ignavibacteriales bacterium]|nr:hypothetical protein [Ignavibacteriales bacterium]